MDAKFEAWKKMDNAKQAFEMWGAQNVYGKTQEERYAIEQGYQKACNDYFTAKGEYDAIDQQYRNPLAG